MEKTVKHRFLNNALFTALIVPLAFFVLRDTIAVLTGLMFESMGGKESFLYQINEEAPTPSRWRSMTAAKTAAPMCLSFLMWVWVRRM